MLAGAYLSAGRVNNAVGELVARPVGPDEQIQRFRQVPGIGITGAYTILTETDDMSRFPTAGQYLSYSRLVPGAANSCGKSRHRNSKQGTNKVNKVLGI